jgi:hypothetical protein
MDKMDETNRKTHTVDVGRSKRPPERILIRAPITRTTRIVCQVKSCVALLWCAGVHCWPESGERVKTLAGGPDYRSFSAA